MNQKKKKHVSLIYICINIIKIDEFNSNSVQKNTTFFLDIIISLFNAILRFLVSLLGP